MKFSPKLVTIFSDEFSVNFSPIMVIFFVNEKISVWLSGHIFIKIGDNNFWRIFCWIFSTFGDFFGNWWFFWEIKKNIGEWLREAPLNFSTGSNGQFRAGPRNEKWSNWQNTSDPAGSAHKKARRKKFGPWKVDFNEGDCSWKSENPHYGVKNQSCRKLYIWVSKPIRIKIQIQWKKLELNPAHQLKD